MQMFRNILLLLKYLWDSCGPAVFPRRLCKMGAKVSRIGGRILRKPLETERRLNKILDSKPSLAPKHPSSKEAIKKISLDSKEQFMLKDRKDDKFLAALKDFKIDSTDVKMHDKLPSKPLPQERRSHSTLPTTELAKGKITSEKLTQLFKDHMQSPSVWTEKKIADHYHLNEHDVENLLKYFSGYAVIEKRELPEPLTEKIRLID